MKKHLFTLLTIFFNLFLLNAQDDDLLSLVGEDQPTTEYATAAFKTNRVINGHSIENTAAGVLDVKIAHRFSPISEGFYDIFGLDGATIRIGVDYGITDRLMVGIGRNSFEKIYDGFAKYKILRQSTGKVNMPITLSYLADFQITTLRNTDPDRQLSFSDRLYYTHQLLLGRKFSENFSAQLMPTLVHRNLVPTPQDNNDVIAIGFAARQKVSKRLALTAEYYYVLPNQISDDFTNSLSVGFDVETGGHVFQFHFSNSQYMTYKGFITETTDKWFNRNGTDNILSGIRFGFNIARVFTIVKPKAFE
jgi:hypothetical protein